MREEKIVLPPKIAASFEEQDNTRRELPARLRG